MSQRSISSFIIANAVNIVASFLMISVMAEYFIKGGLPYAYGTFVMVAFTRATKWSAFMTCALLVLAIYREMRRKIKWWWHNFIFFICFGIGAALYAGVPDLFGPVFYVLGIVGIGTLSSIAGFSFIIGLTRKITMTSAMNIWTIIMVIIGIIPFTPFADILGKAITDACFFTMTTAGVGPTFVITTVTALGTIAFVMRAIALIERFKPRLVAR